MNQGQTAPLWGMVLNVWQARAGRVVLYLPDSNHPQNTSADRMITSTLRGARADGSSPDLLAMLTRP